MGAEIMRLPDWDIRLNDYIQSRFYMPFKWGLNDCATFSMGAIKAMTGIAPTLADYGNRKEAVQLLRSMARPACRRRCRWQICASPTVGLAGVGF